MSDLATGYEQIIGPTPLIPRDQATLLTTAPRIGDIDAKRAGLGVTFRTRGLQDLSRSMLTTCGDEEDERERVDSESDIVTFRAFSIFADEFCSALTTSAEEMAEWGTVRMSAFESAQLANEVMTGSLTGNAALRDGDTIGSGSPVKLLTAMAFVEQELATRLHGAVGMIHVPPAVLFAMNAGGGLDEEEGDEIPSPERARADARHRLGDGASEVDIDAYIANELESNPPQYDRWQTPTGHYVVADAGYDGADPEGDDSGVSDGVFWIYGSGLVEWEMSPPSPVANASETFDTTRNTRTPVLRRDAVYRFDPESTFGLPVDLTLT